MTVIMEISSSIRTTSRPKKKKNSASVLACEAKTAQTDRCKKYPFNVYFQCAFTSLNKVLNTFFITNSTVNLNLRLLQDVNFRLKVASKAVSQSKLLRSF